MIQNLKIAWVGTDDHQQLVERNHGLEEEVKMLRLHVADMYQAWRAGRAPPPPPPSFLDSVLTHTLNPMLDDPPHSPYIPTYHNFPSHPSSSITRPPSMIFQCYSPPQHQYSPWKPQNGTSLSRYPVPQKAYPQRKPPRTGFRGNEAFRKERLLKRAKVITPIGESYANLFERLKHAGQIEPLPRCTPNPRAKGFDPTARCAYHSNVEGHSIENCHNLKRKVERMIRERRIVIDDSDREHADPLGNSLNEAADD